MADLVGQALLSAAFQVLFERLATPALLNSFGRWKKNAHGDRLLEKLKLTLLGLNKVLDDAEKQQITNQSVKDWLDELKDVVYHADDLLDEIATEVLRRKSESEYQSGTNQVRASTRTSTSSSFDAKIMSKMEEIVDKLEYFAKAKDVLGLKEGVRQNQSYRLPSTSLVDDEYVVCGRDNEKEKIIKILLSDEASCNKMDVIPIVGMGGLGKTTLAQLVYNNGKVDKHFDMKSWVWVSEELDVFRVTKTIIEAVTKSTCNITDLNLLQVKLKECLMGKKFLIVLDDIWNENPNDWEILRTPFTVGAYGSKIIATTRHFSVASIMQTIPVYHLQQLSHEDCWSLFAKIAFDKGDSKAYPKLENIGKQIVERCQGLPLAAKTLAGLLRFKLDIEEWDDVLKSDIWDLPEDKNKILPTLRLSYHYLPSNLKQCFAYCSIFPKQYKFKKEKLILLWIAQDFVQQPKRNKTLEKLGDEYFHELLSRSIFQKSSDDISSFVMHDLVHDLAQVVSGQFSFSLEMTMQQNLFMKVRHFLGCACSDFDIERFKEIIEAISKAKGLRSLLSIDLRFVHDQYVTKKVLDDTLPTQQCLRVLLDDTLPTQQCLRVLSLPHYGIIELPNSIGNLIHLRYLDLSRTLIKKLPEKICTLYNLQTLLLSNCEFLTTLPVEIGKLICLRHLYISGTNLSEMPTQMSRLKDLQHLTDFVVGKLSGSAGINELKEYHQLRGTLTISRLQNVGSGRDASEAKLKEKEHLEELQLEWGCNDNSENERQVLENLQPHTNLKRLGIKRYGGTRFPKWLGHHSYSNIVSLYFDGCDYCISLPPLGQLVSLKHVTITRMKGITMVGQEFYGDGSLRKPFQSLQTLCFEEMLEWEEWHILGAGEFSHLQELRVIKCPKLVGGLPKHIPSWVRLEIRECSRLMASIPRTCAARQLVLKGCDGVELGWQDYFSSLVELEISGMLNLKDLTPELCTLTNLKELRITECPNLLSFPDTGLPPMLRSLCVERCEALQIEMERLRCCHTCLVDLNLVNCGLPKHLLLEFFLKLQNLTIENCKSLETISISNGHALQNLRRLEIRSCDNMVSFPRGGLAAPNLTWLRVSNCKKLKAIPEQMHTLLPSLQTLFVSYCPVIELFTEELGLQRLTTLRDFELSGNYADDVVESFLELLPSTLTHLILCDLPNLKSFNNSNRGFQLPSSLKLLHISSCPQLQSLPGNGLPASLKDLVICSCPQLQSLPEMGLPASLFVLRIDECPLLKARCQRERGDDWHKIAHIAFVKIDSEVIIDSRLLAFHR